MSNLSQSVFTEFLKSYNNQIQSLNARIVNLEEKLNKLFNDFVGVYDLFYAHDRIQKMSGMSLLGMHQFAKERVGIDFQEMTPDLKINTLLQYIEASTIHSPQTYNKLIIESFKLRNRLITLTEGQTPEKNDIAMISWELVSKDGMTIVKQEYTAYTLGSNAILVDDEIMKMKIGEHKEFNVNFPVNYANKSLAGTHGKVRVLLHSFERLQMNQNKNLSEEDKKKVWKDKYEAHVIE